MAPLIRLLPLLAAVTACLAQSTDTATTYAVVTSDVSAEAVAATNYAAATSEAAAEDSTVETSATATATAAAATTSNCESYGIDFQSGGTYFQNESSTSPFTFVSLFEGCNKDICQNLLVAPSGQEYLCSNTTLTPSDTYEQSTCNIDKDQLVSGDWSILLISNNGDGAPVAFERDFSLTVGIPSTITATPTVTVDITTVAVQNSTTTVVTDITTHVTTTTTVPSTTVIPTKTLHPTTTTDITTTLGTVSKTAHTVVPSYVTSTHTAHCTVPHRQPHPDPTCTFTPTKITAAALQTQARRIRGMSDRRVPTDRKQRLQERKDRLEVAPAAHPRKRGVDSATTTVTATNTTLFPTVTSTITASTSTMVITTIETSTITSTITDTVLNGATTYPTVTVTAPTVTITRHHFTVITTTVTTITYHPTLTLYTTVVPIQSAKICHAKGGHMS